MASGKRSNRVVTSDGRAQLVQINQWRAASLIFYKPSGAEELVITRRNVSDVIMAARIGTDNKLHFKLEYDKGMDDSHIYLTGIAGLDAEGYSAPETPRTLWLSSQQAAAIGNHLVLYDPTVALTTVSGRQTSSYQIRVLQISLRPRYAIELVS